MRAKLTPKEANEQQVGQRYGQLTVLKYVGQHSTGDRLYLCRCNCGQELTTGLSKLKSGKRTSCGCGRSKPQKLRFDLTSQRFGKLLVVEQANGRSKSGAVQWVCQCDCGSSPKFATTSQLKGGVATDCGNCDARIDSAKTEYQREYMREYRLGKRRRPRPN